MRKKNLGIVFTAGIILAAGICMVLIFLSLNPGRVLFNAGLPERDVFHRLLREYDAILAASSGRGEDPAGRSEPDSLGPMLDKLEKNAQGVETWLSVLKRRRNLALGSPRFLDQYREAALRAAAAFPYSEPLAAVAAEALLRNSPLTGEALGKLLPETAGKLKKYVSLIANTRLTPLALGVRILSGDLESPESAAASGLEPLLAAGLPLIRGSLPADERNRLIADLGILRLLRKDISGAAAQIQTIQTEMQDPAQGEGTVALLHFIAEYYYDFGDPLRAAEIFSRFSDEASMIRSADALALGDQAAAARNIWKILATSQGNPSPDAQAAAASGRIRIRSLYNLAATAAPEPASLPGRRFPGSPPEDQPEAAAWLERLFTEGRNNPSLQSDPCFYFGIIRYTRLLDTNRALAILEDAELQKQPLLDLELLRRREELWPVDRIVAETWLLLGRHPEAAELYQWGAYYFDHQRKYDESAVLIKNAAFHRIRGPWFELNAAIRFIDEGRLDEAEERLLAIPRSARIWQVNANLARILEARHAPAAALEQYEIAASLVKKSEAASRVQLRIAGCLRTLGRVEESRRVLEYALDLNPDNLKARMELRRIGSE